MLNRKSLATIEDVKGQFATFTSAFMGNEPATNSSAQVDTQEHLPENETMSENVTRHELDAHLGAMRSEMATTLAQIRSDIAEMRSGITVQISGLDARVNSEVASIRGDIAGIKGEMAGTKHSVETIKWFITALIAVIGLVAGIVTTVAFKGKPEQPLSQPAAPVVITVPQSTAPISPLHSPSPTAPK